MARRPLLCSDAGAGVRVLTLNRPHARNALSNPLLRQLAEATEAARDDDDVRCVVVTGSHGTFASGADLNELARRNTVSAIVDIRPHYWERIRRFPKPLIAAVEGYALGGGCELAMHADIVIAGEGAKIGQPEVALGIIPGAGGTQRLVRRVGPTLAMRMVLTGERISGKEAQQAGLVTEAVADGKALERALEFAGIIAAKAPLAMRLAKEAVLAASDLPLDWGLILERKSYGALLATRDFQEGITSFVEKRKPRFTGS